MTNEELILKYKETNNIIYRNKLIENNINFIKYCLKSYIYSFSNSIEKDEFINIGVIGFIKAIDNYDINFMNKSKITSYAKDYIVNEIKRYITSNNRLVRLPENIYFSMYLINIPENKNKTDEEIARDRYVNPSDIKMARKINQNEEVLNLDEKFGEGDEGLYLYEKISTEEILEDLIIKEEKNKIINKKLKHLNDRERKYFNLKMKGFNLSQIGEMEGISRERVRQIEKIYIKKLQKELKMINY